MDEDGFVQQEADDYDDEGHRKDEPDYIPRHICVFEETEEGKWYCSQEDLIKFVEESHDIEDAIISTKIAYDGIIDWVQESWHEEMANHLKRVANADPSFPIIIYRDEKTHEDKVADGFHRIIRATLMGIDKLEVKRIRRLPELKFLPHSPKRK